MTATGRNDAINLVNVFTSDSGGGNLAPIVLRAEGLTDEEMRGVARRHDRESSFVLQPPRTKEGADVDFQLRFFVPEHEMEMCGHATVGTAWAMHELGISQKPELRFMTKSGLVRTIRRVEQGDGHTAQVKVFVSQPRGTVEDVVDSTLLADILSVLRITEAQLEQKTPRSVQNACTSRVKTAIALRDADVLNNLQPDFSRVKDLCERLGSTGLYPYAMVQGGNGNGPSGRNVVQVEARQFPKASGYPEDAATGIAAAALSYALAANGVLSVGQEAVVYQGRAMGYPSQINVLLEEDGCWVGGTCAWENQSK
ncbi:uncharacterized protein PV07_04971 [Cladophialophora immunda]|uniref:Phenazine biosynthesis protein PhzF family n=1 Tax=Cladophialophora immunda TaxID=569365 RepID=A0A0D2CFX8_9EURO|nr:uncharacterized protein PV07_04971 [Cladophialophora immunda]KIW29135.1 hypothetical protein PV07_04971 [Cladophialophora immunda]OQU96973.1 hypothetical protein CLAIMM_02978 [Cladophialophora immunda]